MYFYHCTTTKLPLPLQPHHYHTTTTTTNYNINFLEFQINDSLNMDSPEVKALSQKLTYLSKNLRFDVEFKTQLVSKEVITIEQMEVIEEEKGEAVRITKLIAILTRTNLRVTFPLFLDVLDEVNRNDLRMELKEAYDTIKLMEPVHGKINVIGKYWKSNSQAHYPYTSYTRNI